jgi:hypothetical protein
MTSDRWLVPKLRPQPSHQKRKVFGGRSLQSMGEARLDDNEICIFDARRANVSGWVAWGPCVDELVPISPKKAENSALLRPSPVGGV